MRQPRPAFDHPDVARDETALRLGYSHARRGARTGELVDDRGSGAQSITISTAAATTASSSVAAARSDFTGLGFVDG